MKKKTVPTLTEITLLSGEEFLHLEQRSKTRFDYPLHRHTEIELNFIENFCGLRRVVGDSVEDVRGDRELVLVGSGLEHCWEEGEHFQVRDTYEITTQFSPNLFVGPIFANPHMAGLVRMLLDARRGVCFGESAVTRVLPLLREMATLPAGFHRFQKLMLILYLLAETSDYRLLSTESFARSQSMDDNKRITAVTNYIREHYSAPIRLEDLAKLAYMSPTAFSHFFKLRTHKTVCDYIIDERLGVAIRELVDGRKSILEICYASGFQNVSNFNRQFKRRHGCTPSEYRANYQHSRRNVKTTGADCPEIDEYRSEIHPSPSV